VNSTYIRTHGATIKKKVILNSASKAG